MLLDACADRAAEGGVDRRQKSWVRAPNTWRRHAPALAGVFARTGAELRGV